MTDLVAAIRAALPAGYTLTEKIGGGGQGAVFSGTKDGIPVAIKLFGPTDDPQRLSREVDLLSKNTCPYVVGLVDHFTLTLFGQPVPVVVYDFVAGPDLRTVLAGGGQPDDASLIRLGTHVGEALESLWHHRIVHRDVKPENIIEVKDDRYVLVDVGFAQHLELGTITRGGGQPGTNGYRSPEQCGGRRRLTIHSDVFALGVTMFEYATRNHPWQRNQLAMRAMPPESFQRLRPGGDSRIGVLVHQMMSSVPARRPTDPGQRFRGLGGA